MVIGFLIYVVVSVSVLVSLVDLFSFCSVLAKSLTFIDRGIILAIGDLAAENLSFVFHLWGFVSLLYVRINIQVSTATHSSFRCHASAITSGGMKKSCQGFELIFGWIFCV